MTKTAFLLGAGASVDAGIPAMVGFTADFKKSVKALGSQYASLSALYDRLHSYHAKTGIPAAFNLEHLYSYVYKVNRHIAIAGLRLQKDRDTELIEYFLKLHILKRCGQIGSRNVRYLEPLLRFMSSTRPLNIFSLNYDVCIEKLCAARGIPVFDGFTGPKSRLEWAPHFFKKNLRDQKSIVQLIKLHGSVLWYEDSVGAVSRLTDISTLRYGGRYGAARPLVPERLLLYPATYKSSVREPYYSLFGYFREVLERAYLLVVLGYSFPDEHIQEMLFDSARKNERLRFLIVDPHGAAVAARLANSANIDPSRISFIEGTSAFARNALQRDKLLHRVTALINPSKRKNPPSHLTTYVQPIAPMKRARVQQIAGVTGPIGGLVVVKATNELLVTRYTAGELWAIDPNTRRARRISVNLNYPRGICVDELRGLAYIVENGSSISHARKSSLIEGLGSVAIIDLNTGAIHARNAGAAHAARNTHLNWPTTALLHYDRKQLHVTESQQLRRIDISRSGASRVVKIPLCFNLATLDRLNRRVALAFDQGVFDETGAGRIFTVNLRNGRTRLMTNTPPYCMAARRSRVRKLVYVLQRSPSGGRLLTYDVTRGSWVSQVALPTRPTDLALSEKPNGVYIAGADGVYAMELLP